MEQQQQHHTPAPKKTLGPGGWIAVIVLAGIVFFIAQKTGCGPVKTESKMEWIDR